MAARVSCLRATFLLAAAPMLMGAAGLSRRACAQDEGALARGFAVIVGVGDFSEAEGEWANLPACVSDAVELSKLLASEPFYRGTDAEKRIHLFTQAPSGSPAAVPYEIPHVNWQTAFRDGAAGVLAALGDLAGKATAGDVVLVYVGGHSACEAGQVRLLLPGYRPDDSATYLGLESVVAALGPTRAAIVFALDACYAEGGVQTEGSEYYYDLLIQEGRYRAVIVSAGADQTAHSQEGHTIFGKAFREGLSAGELASGGVTVQSLMPYLEANVTAAAGALGVAQTPVCYAFAAGVGEPTLVRGRSVAVRAASGIEVYVKRLVAVETVVGGRPVRMVEVAPVEPAPRVELTPTATPDKHFVAEEQPGKPGKFVVAVPPGGYDVIVTMQGKKPLQGRPSVEIREQDAARKTAIDCVVSADGRSLAVRTTRAGRWQTGR